MVTVSAGQANKSLLPPVSSLRASGRDSRALRRPATTAGSVASRLGMAAIHGKVSRLTCRYACMATPTW